MSKQTKELADLAKALKKIAEDGIQISEAIQTGTRYIVSCKKTKSNNLDVNAIRVAIANQARQKKELEPLAAEILKRIVKANNVGVSKKFAFIDHLPTKTEIKENIIFLIEDSDLPTLRNKLANVKNMKGGYILKLSDGTIIPINEAGNLIDENW